MTKRFQANNSMILGCSIATDDFLQKWLDKAADIESAN
jgi:hypothetical protein